MNETNKDKHSALALVSGGLDSQLAAKLIHDQGVEVTGVNFKTGFTSEGDAKLFTQIEKDIGVEIRTLPVDEEKYLEIIKNPEHGYGSAMNPCLDCRILVLKEAKSYMQEVSADFVITGEVMGQRPMTQRKDTLDLIKRESGLDEQLLRPLSAKLMDPTLPEKKGWINREELLDLSGRSRKKQLELAERYGINHYSQPAGGCLLTEPEFGHRIKEVFDHRGRRRTTLEDLKLLKYGRHFRLPDGSKAVIGRNEEENEKLKTFVDGESWHLELDGVLGPSTIIKGEASEKELVLAARLTARYSQGRDRDAVDAVIVKNGEKERCKVEPINRDSGLIDELMIEWTN